MPWGEERRQRPGQGDGIGFCVGGGSKSAADQIANVLLVLPVAAQVEPYVAVALAAHQRSVSRWFVAVRHQGGVVQGVAPGGEIQLGQQVAGQRRRVAQVVAFRRQRERQVGGGESLGEIEAHVAAAELMAGQRRGEQQQGRGVVHLALEEARQRPIQRAQPAALHPAVEQGEQRLGVVKRGLGVALRGLVRFRLGLGRFRFGALVGCLVAAC